MSGESLIDTEGGPGLRASPELARHFTFLCPNSAHSPRNFLCAIARDFVATKYLKQSAASSEERGRGEEAATTRAPTRRHPSRHSLPARTFAGLEATRGRFGFGGVQRALSAF